MPLAALVLNLSRRCIADVQVDPSGHLKIIVSFLQVRTHTQQAVRSVCDCVIACVFPCFRLEQILTNMAFVLDVEWPPTYSRFIALFNFINLVSQLASSFASVHRFLIRAFLLCRCRTSFR